MHYRRGVEIGAGDSFSSSLLKRYREFQSVHLYEPNDLLFKDLSSVAKKIYNATAFNSAVTESARSGIFYSLGYCSFLKKLPAPILLYCSDPPDEILTSVSQKIECVGIGDIEGSDVDVLRLTCNGSELPILKSMKMRPQIIEMKLATHENLHKIYAKEIFQWMAENEYKTEIKFVDRNRISYHFSFTKQ